MIGFQQNIEMVKLSRSSKIVNELRFIVDYMTLASCISCCRVASASVKRCVMH